MKTIRILIALALVIGALALDMSSLKRRTETSSYVAMYTALGLKYGYKQNINTYDYGDYFMEYIIKWKDANGKFHSASNSEYCNKITTPTKYTLSFPYSQSDFNSFPDALKNFCTGGNCVITTANMLQYFENTDGGYFQIDYTYKKQNRAVYLFVQNTSDDPNCDPYDYYPKLYLKKQAEQFKIESATVSDRFYEILSSMEVSCQRAITYLNQIKSTIAEGRASVEKEIKRIQDRLDHYRKEKQQLEQSINISNKQIAELETKVNTALSDKRKCEEEKVDLNNRIEAEKIRIQQEKKKIADFIKQKEQERSDAVTQLFYRFESAYYYRVFAEKIVKTPAECTTAVDSKHMESTKEKLTKAFFPIKINFADPNAK